LLDFRFDRAEVRRRYASISQHRIQVGGKPAIQDRYPFKPATPSNSNVPFNSRNGIIMKTSNAMLLAATVLGGFTAGAAQAQIVLPAAELRGVGASSITTVQVQVQNCVGNPGAGLNKAGTNSGALSTVTPGFYNPTVPSATNPVLDCATQEVQPDFQAKYVATGSGFGRQMWRLFSNQFTGAAGSINPFGTWTNVQYAFSDSPATQTDLNDYTANANNATNKAGPAIQFPLYVLPVTLAYDPRYGVQTTGGGPVDLNFNLKAAYIAKDSAGNPVGGMRLSKSLYCKVFNGEVTNFNDPAFKAANGAQDLRSLSDVATRWTSEGVPIRLVGRVDNSGTTDIFTRHLAAVCGAYVATNKFDQAAEALPYWTGSTINMTSFRSDSPYFPGSTKKFSNNTATHNSATYQSISGAFFNRTTQAIVTTQGAEAPGKFMLADGSSGVRDAIKFAPDKTSTVDATIKLNGHFGYIGSDFVKPSPGAVLFSAALQEGVGTAYRMPTPTFATTAVGTILPPQTTATTGVFNTSDTRTNSVTGLPVSRANPLDWTDVLYSNPAKTLANPTTGYPITGTTQFLTYTCFSSIPKRLATAEMLGVTLAKVTKKSDGTALSANTFRGTAIATLGIIPQTGIVGMPAAWTAAISETFLKKSVQASNGTVLGSLNLWVQSALPTTLAQTDGIGTNDVQSNPVCTANTGA